MNRRIAFAKIGVAVCVFALLVATMKICAAASPTPEEASLTKVGQPAPAFKVTALDGKEYSVEGLRGKIVLLNFFATWCGPCLAELPHVEKEIWQKYKDRGLVVLVVGREHPNEQVAAFQKKQNYTFPMAADPKREIYGKYATQYIPRTYLIDKEGKIAYQAVGYTEPEFKSLLAALEKEFSSK